MVIAFFVLVSIPILFMGLFFFPIWDSLEYVYLISALMLITFIFYFLTSFKNPGHLKK